MASQKRINGKVYDFEGLYFRDWEAKRIAEGLKKKGYATRVTGKMTGNIHRGGNVDRMEYIVWYRRKKVTPTSSRTRIPR